MVLLGAGASCSGDGDDDGGDGGDAAALGLAEAVASLPLMEGLPDDVVFGDLARAADVAGVELSGGPGDETVLRSIGAITGGPVGDDGELSPVSVRLPELGGYDQLGEMAAFADELGWSLADVDGFAEYRGVHNRVTVFAGDFDEDRLTAALGPPEDGVWVAGDPDQGAGSGSGAGAEPTAARPTGDPLWLALVDDRLVVARNEAVLAGVRSGTGSTLADDPIFRPLTEALDEAGAYAATLSGRTLAAPEACPTALPEAIAGVASGIADDDGPVVVLAYANASPAGADANAAALASLLAEGASSRSGRPWSGQVEVEGIDVEGPTVVARLRLRDGASPSLWFDVVRDADNIVSSCA